MTAVEIILILVGIVFMVGSFFVTEKLSQKEITQISELSSVEMKRILEKNMENAQQKVETLVDDVVEQSVEETERLLVKETNLKIQNISEYSESVMEAIHKNHEEVMFLYSMLNDKHTELTKMAKDLEQLKYELLNLQDDVSGAVIESTELVQKMSEQIALPIIKEMEEKTEISENIENVEEVHQNNNRDILELYREGMGVTDIARQLGLGVGEVKLVIDLYREEEI